MAFRARPLSPEPGTDERDAGTGGGGLDDVAALRARVAALEHSNALAIERYELMIVAAGVGWWDMAGVLRDINNEKTLIDTSQRQLDQLTAFSGRLVGVSSDLSEAVNATVSKAAHAFRRSAPPLRRWPRLSRRSTSWFRNSRPEPAGQRSIRAVFPSSCRWPAAGVRLFSRSIWPALSSMPSAAVFSSTRATRRVPGIGAMSSPWISSQARAICAGVASASPAMAPYFVDDPQVVPEVLAGETRVGLTPVVVRDVVDRADLAGEKAVAERRVRHEADPQLAQYRQQFGFRFAGPQRVFGLQRGDRVDGVRPANGLRAGHSSRRSSRPPARRTGRGLALIAFSADAGSPDDDALRLLASWAAGQQPADA